MNIKAHQDFPQKKFLSIKRIFNKSPISKFLKAEIELLSSGFARIRIPFRSDFLQGFGVVQGGIIATAGDMAAAIALLTLIESNETMATIDLKINFLTPIKTSDIFSEGKIIHKGSLISLGEFEVKTSEGILAAKGISTLTSRVKRKGI
ncbi:MAG: PaaI family thioesterase [Thermodesulfobacteriota bacterium]|jgi:acyl-CoA thioesterase|nr:MAG: PaaI family thioesterase [Thermodesulfobacteriota bacterium]